MANKPQPMKEQADTEDELLNFDLEELADDEGSAEDEVIELVELVEAEEDKTGELMLRNRLEEGSVVMPAKLSGTREAVAPALTEDLLDHEAEPELDLSDLTLDMDLETTRPAQTVGEEEITEADLESLLQDSSDEEITVDLSSDEESAQEGTDEEVTDADLEALLQEATVEGLEEAKEEVEILEIVSEAEAVEQVPLEEEKPALTDIESLADSVEGQVAVTEPLIEQVVQIPARAEGDQPMVAEELIQKEIATEEPPVEELAGISEARLEEIITKVVQDVVERVAKETMASVAERVIGQAIEALKASLETSSEES